MAFYNHYKPSKRSLFTAVAVGLLLAMLALFSWYDHVTQGGRNFNKQIQTKGNYQVEQIESYLDKNLNQLINLTARIEQTGGSYFQHWSWEAQRMIDQNPSIQFVEWIDSNMVIRMIEPQVGNEQAVGLDISKIPHRSVEWKRNTQAKKINISTYVDLKQGGKAFLVDNPMNFGGKFRGTLTIGLNFDSTFHNLLESDGWKIQLKDETGRLFFQSQVDQELADSAYSFTREIALPNQNKTWSYQLTPTLGLYQDEVVFSDLMGFVLSLVLSVLVAVLMYVNRMRKRQEHRLQATNKELQKLNLRLEEEREKAQKASNSKTEFMSNMSHEIRTPLNALMGLIDIMKSKKPEPENKRFLEMMEFSSSSLLSLVNDILDLDKIESGQLSLKQESFSPHERMVRLHELFKPGFDQKDLPLKLMVSGDDACVIGDPNKFSQIAINLVRNAFKFTYEGEVTIKLHQQIEGENVKISLQVIDTGIGIPLDKKLNIFDRFTQVDSSRSRQYEGTGLGLAITEKLVKAMGGSVTVNSEVGVGSEFLIELSLPLSKAPAAAEIPDLDEGHSSYAGNQVLIAEDNQINIMVLKNVLKQFSIEADVACNGEEVLEAVSNKNYHLIFMDVHMPVMDGFEATRRLRSEGYTMPIVALSANVTAEASAEASKAGMQRYLTKPFSRQGLQKILREFLDLQSAQL